ncbi:hypothetical protein QJQ45_013255 [Haematococcus lacustris]|nr:hypothetical protein QJQ45_013255 [Haematococcus lacustris]
MDPILSNEAAAMAITKVAKSPRAVRTLLQPLRCISGLTCGTGSDMATKSQAQALLSQHPVTQSTLSDMKLRYDQRQGNSAQPRNLEAFYMKHDTGAGEVRVEDFKAGWSLGGVVLGPSQMDTMKSAFGTDRCTIKYPEVLADLDTMGAAKATALVMTNKMGPITARFKGFTQEGGSGAEAIATGTFSASMKALSEGPPNTRFQTHGLTPLTSSALMRTSQGVPIQTAGNLTTGSTFNSTTVVNSSVTQRAKTMQPRSVQAIKSRISSLAAHTDCPLASMLMGYDPQHTGCVTLDAFLTACAKAEITIKPALRDVEQSLMGTVDGLQGDLDDLQAAHQSLQAIESIASLLAQYWVPLGMGAAAGALQLLKHGGGRYMELPALLQLMSLNTCKEAMKTVDVHDLQQHMGQLRAEVRRKEDATAAAQRSAKAERQITVIGCAAIGLASASALQPQRKKRKPENATDGGSTDSMDGLHL